MLFYSFNYLIFLIAKFYFLKLHYYKFHKCNYYRSGIKSSKKVEVKLIKTIGNGFCYKSLVFFFKYGFKIFLILNIFKNLVFDAGVIYLGYLPYYSCYYLLYNIYEFVIICFVYDFEIAIISKYYPSANIFLEKNEFKDQQYLKFLIFGKSKFLFKDCIYMMYPELIKKNWLIVNNYKYSINKKPNDFFNIVKNYDPEFKK